MQKASSKTTLTYHQRSAVLAALVCEMRDGELPKGSQARVAQELHVHPSAVPRVWLRAQETYASTGVLESRSRKKLTGRKRRDTSEQLEHLREMAPESRATIRAAAAAIDMPATTLFRRLREGELTVSTNVARPLLTQQHKDARFTFCRAHVDPATLQFVGMYDTVHVDEKLFCMTEVRTRCITLPGEQLLTRRFKSRCYIGTVMVLAAVERPRWSHASSSMFDGKLGI